MRLSRANIWQALSPVFLATIGAAALHAQSGAAAVNQQESLQQSEEKKADQKTEQKPAAAPGAQTTQQSPNAVENAKKAKIKWTGSVTGGFQFSRGQTNSNGVSVSGDANYATVRRGYRFEGIVLYAKVRVPISPGVNEQFTAQDKRDGYFTFFQEVHGPVFLVSRASVEHDVLRDIKVRVMDLSGVGFRLAASQRLQVFVAPGIGFAHEDKPGIRDGEIFNAGVFQRATWHINRIWTLDQWFQYRANPANSHDYAMDGSAGLTGLIFTTKLGFNFSYIYSYEGLVGIYGGSVVPQTPYRSLSQTTIGLRFTL